MPAPREIVIVGFEGAQALDFTGPLEVFATAERLAPGRYRVNVASPAGQPFASHSGLRVTPDGSVAELSAGADTLIIAGGFGTRALERDEPFLDSLQAAATRARRVCSVCTGAFLLAAAGVLDGRRATTHWAYCDRLAARYPRVAIEPDRIFVRDDGVWTSAGVTAGMDLALALVEDDHGREAALEVARWLVLHTTRAGGQAQFSEPLAFQSAERPPLRAAQEHVRTDPAAGHTVESLAEIAGMPVRSFARAFKRDAGMTPAAFVETVRVERARELLEAAEITTEAVAERCGFGTVETLRRAFRRRLGTSPGEYRDRFRAALREAA